MKAVRLLVTAAMVLTASCGQRPPPPKPKLIIQITFDQLRGDLLDRYRPALTGGFKRVIDEGWWVQNGEAAHGLTVSFPGHATLATGMYPSHHGLTANEWWQEVDGRWVPASVVRDTRYSIVGAKGETGVSPINMTATTLADWVKAASPQARSVVIGSDSALAYGGKKPDGLWWFDSSAGGYTTSTYYADARPGWVDALNRKAAALPREWILEAPAQLRGLADHPQQCPAFQPGKSWSTKVVRMLGPHRYDPGGKDSTDKFLSWLGSTPLLDAELLRRVPDVVQANNLGRDDAVDYLGVIVGATDSIGHEYGPVSLEQLDTIMRLDKALGGMLDRLDATVGKDNYVLAISADHGSANPPEERCIQRVTSTEIDTVLDRVDAMARTHRGTDQQLIDKMVAELRRVPFIADVYTQARLASPQKDDWKAELMKRSFRPGRTTDFPLWSEKPRPHHPARYGISVVFKPGVIFPYARSVHGSPYAYDRSVPVIFYGAGVTARTLKSGGRTVDVAPTLAELAGLRVPPKLDGHPIIDREKAQ